MGRRICISNIFSGDTDALAGQGTPFENQRPREWQSSQGTLESHAGLPLLALRPSAHLIPLSLSFLICKMELMILNLRRD